MLNVCRSCVGSCYPSFTRAPSTHRTRSWSRPPPSPFASRGSLKLNTFIAHSSVRRTLKTRACLSPAASNHRGHLADLTHSIGTPARRLAALFRCSPRPRHFPNRCRTPVTTLTTMKAHGRNGPRPTLGPLRVRDPQSKLASHKNAETSTPLFLPTTNIILYHDDHPSQHSSGI